MLCNMWADKTRMWQCVVWALWFCGKHNVSRNITASI